MSSVSELTETPGVPSSLIYFGSDDDFEVVYMLYFDERGVSRKYNVTLQDGVWKMWRDVPHFAQRYTGTFDEKGDTINGGWQLSEDNAIWKDDLQITHRRVG